MFRESETRRRNASGFDWRQYARSSGYGIVYEGDEFGSCRGEPELFSAPLLMKRRVVASWPDGVTVQDVSPKAVPGHNPFASLVFYNGEGIGEYRYYSNGEAGGYSPTLEAVSYFTGRGKSFPVAEDEHPGKYVRPAMEWLIEQAAGGKDPRLASRRTAEMDDMDDMDIVDTWLLSIGLGLFGEDSYANASDARAAGEKDCRATVEAEGLQPTEVEDVMYAARRRATEADEAGIPLMVAYWEGVASCAQSVAGA